MGRVIIAMVAAGVVTAGILALPRTPWAAPPPAEAYAALPFAVNARLSPDGQSVALIGPYQGHAAVVIWPLAPGRQPHAIATDPYTPKQVWWKTNTRLVARLETCDIGDGFEPTFATRAIAVDADGTNLINLVPGKTAKVPSLWQEGRYLSQDQGHLIARLADDPDHILLQAEDPEHKYPDVRRVDINDATASLPMRGRAGANYWGADSRGVVRLAIGEAPFSKGVVSIQVRDDADGAWREINRRDTNTAAPRFLPVAFSESDPKILYVRAPSSQGHLALHSFDTGTKAFTAEIAASPLGDIEAEVIDNRLVAYSDPANLDRRLYVDPAWAADLATVDHALPGRVNRIADRSPDGGRVLVWSHDGDNPAGLWLLDRGTGKPTLTEIADNYEAIAPDQVAPVTAVAYRARNGATIPAWLTLPRDHADRPLPFVFLLDDGAIAGHGLDRFDFLAQFLASRGYGVLQPRFRPGGTSHATGAAATKWLIDRKLADPGRIAIVGIGFGGFAALNGAARQPSLFKAAVALAGISDLVELRDRFRRASNRDFLLPLIGTDFDALAATSPARHADRISTPVLLIHGRKDDVVPAHQTETMAAALRAAGKPAEVIYLPEADHDLSHSEDRLTLLKALEGFLAAHLGS